ncbi:protein translocase SEC61 complex subunit gamma [Candidatus Woesearchaeota archaeon]|nr:protein translocase SEC61 complex subunit gamma [Candidatus Woesearchaeota archaeon]
MDENSIWFKLQRFTKECIRVLKITKKPDKTEFSTIVKMSGLGMIIIGLLGFTISMVHALIFS